ncbi:MAG: prepilin peptidase [Defluviitaleaceae bacterium]|nr:prepilin peptidase [Defluviitaleaceae bacterium]
MEIPNGLILALVPFAVFSAVLGWPGGYLLSSVVGFFVVSVPMLVLAMVINGAFGGGDIKLMAVCGFLLGWQNALLAFFIAIVLGGSYAVFLLVSGRKGKREHIPFAPALCVGVFLAMILGQMVEGLYFGLF